MRDDRIHSGLMFWFFNLIEVGAKDIIGEFQAQLRMGQKDAGTI